MDIIMKNLVDYASGSFLPVYTTIQGLDPLRVDDFMILLPEITKNKKNDLILEKLSDIVRQLDPKIFEKIPHAYAALRDLDFLIGSANELESKSYKKVEGLEDILEKLGDVTDHFPRGCNFTYGLMNPDGERMRLFT